MHKKLINSAELIMVVLLFQNAGNAQDLSPEQQQRIRETRLLEWYAKEQARLNIQTQTQNTSLDNSYKEEPASAIAVPEANELFAAAISGNNAQLGSLLSQGLNINTSNVEGETALHMAAARGHYSTVIYLVSKGASVNARTVKNWIPLHHAVRFRHPNIVNYLVRHGSPAYARTSDGLTAIDMANNHQDYRLLSILGAR